ncbi:MAG: DUF1440 domain-containing protein [Gemmatimonadaceae bacterium]
MHNDNNDPSSYENDRGHNVSRGNGHGGNGHGGDVLGDLIKGAVAGAVGVWALDQITWYMWDREDPAALAQERAGRPADWTRHTGWRTRPRTRWANSSIPGSPILLESPRITHYALGILPAALYGAFLRGRMHDLGSARGLAYGLALFALEDELANPLLGTSGPPGVYPWQAHVRGLVGHLTYGAVTDAAIGLLDDVA